MKRSATYALALGGFVAFEIALIFFVDQPLSQFIRNLDTTRPALIYFFRAITDYGKSIWYLWPSGLGILVCAAALRFGTRSEAQRQKLARLGQALLYFFLSVAVSGLFTDAIKPLLGRARPVEWDRKQAYGFHPITFHATWNSMPSGHATSAAAVAVALWFLVPRYRVVWMALGLLLAFSRVMVNAHYLSDVLAGIMMGGICSYAFWHRLQREGMFPRLKGIFPIDKTPPGN
jgi:undecaprenyl-diphosphatase